MPGSRVRKRKLAPPARRLPAPPSARPIQFDQPGMRSIVNPIRSNRPTGGFEESGNVSTNPFDIDARYQDTDSASGQQHGSLVGAIGLGMLAICFGGVSLAVMLLLTGDQFKSFSGPLIALSFASLFGAIGMGFASIDTWKTPGPQTRYDRLERMIAEQAHRETGRIEGEIRTWLGILDARIGEQIHSLGQGIDQQQSVHDTRTVDLVQKLQADLDALPD
jgi:hypothetical protein